VVGYIWFRAEITMGVLDHAFVTRKNAGLCLGSSNSLFGNDFCNAAKPISSSRKKKLVPVQHGSHVEKSISSRFIGIVRPRISVSEMRGLMNT
jgi:hypothetical protein